MGKTGHLMLDLEGDLTGKCKWPGQMLRLGCAFSYRVALYQARHSQRLDTLTCYSSMITFGPDWKHTIPTDATVPPYSVFTKPIEKSPQDEREYRIIQLENGLKATLIHDIETDKAAASLDVAVGHLHDPVCFFRYQDRLTHWFNS